MFEKNISKKTYTTIGTIFILLGISFMGLALYMFLSPIEEVNYTEIRNNAFTECSDVVRKSANLAIRQESSIEQGEIKIFSRDLGNSFKKVYASSFIIESCKDFIIQDYCYGEACKYPEVSVDGGLYMTLKFKYQNKI